MKPAEAFGKVLRRLREEKGISQEQLALNSDLDRTFVSKLERGIRQPSLTSILIISKTLSTKPEKLIKMTCELMDS